MAKKVEIFTKSYCPFCKRAKNLLESKKIAYTENDVEKNPDNFARMQKMSNGARSVPQIFIDGKHIGGCDDLYALNESGELDKI